MNPDTTAMGDAPRDRWMDSCGAAAFVSLLLIVVYIACPPMTGLQLPYAGGGAAVLGIGATLCLALHSRSARLAAAIALMGLISLRTLSAFRPDLLVAEHGELTLLDAGGLALLVLTAVLLVSVAIRTASSGPLMTQHPTDAPNGASG